MTAEPVDFKLLRLMPSLTLLAIAIGLLVYSHNQMNRLLEENWWQTANGMPEGAVICPRGYSPSDPYADMRNDENCFTKVNGQVVSIKELGNR